MKINNVKDICVFLDTLRHWCSHDCSTCILNEDDIDLKGDLEVVKECEHDWSYGISNATITRRCILLGCDAEETINLLSDVSCNELATLFEETK